MLIDGKWTICITEKSLKEVLNIYTEAAGATIISEKTIYFPDKENSINKSFYHELGHAIDSTCGDLSSSSEFKVIYLNERNSFKENYDLSYYYINNKKEYFGEAFEKYIQDKELFKTCCPETFAFFDKIIKE